VEYSTYPLKKNTHTSMFKLKNLCIIILLLNLLFIPPVSADDSGSFIESEGFQESFDYLPLYSNNFDLEYLVFKEVSYYKYLQSVKISEIPQGDISFNTSSMARQTPITIKNGSDTIGTGSIGYGRSIQTNNATISIYLDSWNIGLDTGEKSYTLEYDKVELGIDHFKKWDNGLQQTSDEHLALQFNADVLNRELPGHYRVTHLASFQNDYIVTDFPTYYLLDIIKVIAGQAYNSTWLVYTSEGVYLNGSSLVNESLLVGEAPIFLECDDDYGNSYSATVYGVPVGTLSISGHTINAENNAIISDVLVGINGYANFSNESGYYLVDGLYEYSTYNLSANKTDYMTYEMNISTSNQNLSLDIPLFRYGLDEFGNHDPSIPYLAGIVKNAGNYSSIRNAVVTLRNNSTTYNSITNANGLFSIYPDSNGTYTLTVIKPGFYSHESTVTVSGATSKYVALLPLLEEVEDEDYTPDSPFAALYDFFDDLGLSPQWVDAIIALAIIASLGLLFASASKNSSVPIVGMFLGFVVSIALGLLPLYFLTIVIIVVIALLLSKRSGG